MTNWHDPALEEAEGIALIKLVHVVAGVYLWEFVLNFDYEYSIIMGKRKFTRTIPLYVGCRWFTLFAIITQLVGLDDSNGRMNCEALAIMSFVSSYFSFLSASFLIILRIYALWEHKKLVVVATFAIWLGNTIAYVYNMVVTRAHQLGSICEVDHIVDIRISILSSFITDVVLLSLMLLGVLRWKQARRKGGIWWVLYTQGLIYVVIVTISDVPNVIFILLNLNEPLDRMFMIPGMVVMSIGALRLYKGLANSPALGSTPGVDREGMKELADIRFAAPSHPGSRGDGTHGAVLDSTSLSGGVQQVWFITKQGEGSSGSETA